MASDDKITSLLSALPPHTNYFSLEFFPPKTAPGFNNLHARLHRMAHSLRPLFVTVTWGAGGSTSTKSLELAEICQRQLAVPTCLHLTCTNMKRQVLDDALDFCKDVGIRNILALRGDRPRDFEYKVEGDDDHEPGEEKEDFVWAVDLVRYIRQNHGDYFCIGVAGYPEGHSDESHPTHQSVEFDLPYLVEKVQAGADFIMTQLTYDLEAYSGYEQRLRCHESGVFHQIPIIPGLMPVQSYQILKRITKLSHCKVPPAILERIEKVKADDEQVKKLGVDILSEIVEGMRNLATPSAGGRCGFHFYTLNLEKSVAFILERCRLVPDSKDATPGDSPGHISEDAVSDGDKDTSTTNGTEVQRFSRRRASSVNAQPHNRVITKTSKSPKSSRSPREVRTNGTVDEDSDSQTLRHQAPERGTGIPASNPTRKNELLISEGQGSLGREATWDDFPNGRWGPSHSPAFGEVDGYGPSLKVGPVTARKLWGRPRTRQDVTEVFRRHVLGELGCVPWSDEIGEDIDGSTALKKETDTIRPLLLALIESGKWTLASQPAVNGVKSDDEVFGWGPPGEGFVFQKAFVEFFCDRHEWVRLRERLLATPEEEISWLKTDSHGNFESSDAARSAAVATTRDHHQKSLSSSSSSGKTHIGQTGFNAVTWGVFRGKEIVTPTIIEEQSFRAWGDEAYAIWEEWRRVFPRASEEERFLKQCKDDLVLVNVVGHRFVGEREGRKLWDVLLAT